MNKKLYLGALALVALSCDGGPTRPLDPNRPGLLVYDGDDCIPDLDPGCEPYNPSEDQTSKIRLALDEFHINYLEPVCRDMRDAVLNRLGNGMLQMYDTPVSGKNGDYHDRDDRTGHAEHIHIENGYENNTILLLHEGGHAIGLDHFDLPYYEELCSDSPIR